MNDDHLATEISKTIPAGAALAARVAQLERHALAADTDRVAGYKAEVDHNQTTDRRLTTLEQQLAANRHTIDGLRDLVRAAIAIAVVALLATCTAIVWLVTT